MRTHAIRGWRHFIQCIALCGSPLHAHRFPLPPFFFFFGAAFFSLCLRAPHLWLSGRFCPKGQTSVQQACTKIDSTYCSTNCVVSNMEPAMKQEAV